MRIRSLITLVVLVSAILVPGRAAADTSPPTFPILPNQYTCGADHSMEERLGCGAVPPGGDVGCR